MQSKLPEGLKEQIKIEANYIYWQTHKVSRERDPYCKGLTMFEVAQVPIINALIEKEERYLELKARCEKMAGLLDEMKYYLSDLSSDDPVDVDMKKRDLSRIKKAVAWTDGHNTESVTYIPGKDAALHEGIEKEGEDEVTDSCPHCGKELSRDRNLCCRECGKEVVNG